MLVAFGVSSLLVASSVWGPVLAHVLSGLRGTAAIAASGLIVVLAASGFIAIGGARVRPVAFVFAAAIALGVLTLLSRISWVGERF